MNKENIVLYTSNTSNITINPLVVNETLWLSQEEMAKLFWKWRTTITEHIWNIFKEWELEKIDSIMNVGNSDNSTGKGKILYNLDVIISVWYRVKSIEWTRFRIWANKVLKNHIISWYTINEKRLRDKWLEELEWSLNLIKKALKSWDISRDEALGLLDIITNYSSSWLLLQKYDEDKLLSSWNTKVIKYNLQATEALDWINKLRDSLINKWEASDLFAKLKDNDSLVWIFWNIYQTFDSKELYPSVEEKAANLLYFIVKDHPFIDWNKRSWAFVFILFLASNSILFDNDWNKKINDRALVAITLLIAESNPKDKEMMIKLLVNLIN